MSQIQTKFIADGAITSAKIALGAVSLTTQVSGVLPVANGGTGAATAAQNSVFAGPATGGSGAPAFRALVAADIPSLNYISALTGDVTASGPGSAAATLATVNANVGSFGSSTSIPSFTVNAKGLITAAAGNAVIAPAGTLTGTTLASNVVSSSLTSLGAQAQALDMGTHQINNVVDPSSPQDAATKAYVDSQVAADALKSVSFNYTLSSTDITNQYVDMDIANGFISSVPIQGTSASNNSLNLTPNGGPLQLKGTDYTVSLAGGAGGSTRVSLTGDLATGGNAALVAGDILIFAYAYL